MKTLAAALLVTIAATPAFAGESAGLMLPPGYHATVVADGLGAGARHVAVRSNGDIYISTRKGRDQPQSAGMIAVKVGKDGKAADVQHFTDIEGGTGMALYKGALYVAGGTAIYRFTFKGNELVPSAAPEVVVGDLPKGNMGIGFDGKGGLYTTVRAAGNICADPKVPKDQKPVGLKPCPLLDNGGGMWRFDAEKTNQKFPTDGEQVATGIRDMMAVAWSKDMNGLYGVMQGRNGTAKLVPGMSEEHDTVAEEMHRIDKGANLGWPYSYYDTALHARVLAPEYGGDGKMPADGKYDTPVVAFDSHQSPTDLDFYDGKQFPQKYRGGAFVVFQGGSGPEIPDGRNGYNVTFVPFDKSGKAGTPEIFAGNFAGPAAVDRNTGKAQFRPSGVTVAPDGSLYVVDTLKGRLWHITYDGKN
ncbi:MAG: PQQ-dependent sugar dehydrogenase [Alphaproteobacteria bacterium]|nr:PQQ-dependent sugar dehydrogenase [Alphaproteobacteria bacterium]